VAKGPMSKALRSALLRSSSTASSWPSQSTTALPIKRHLPRSATHVNATCASWKAWPEDRVALYGIADAGRWDPHRTGQADLSWIADGFAHPEQTVALTTYVRCESQEFRTKAGGLQCSGTTRKASMIS
jgi:hypothetical protein